MKSSPVSTAFKALLCQTFLPVSLVANAPPHSPASYPLKTTCSLLFMSHTLKLCLCSCCSWCLECLPDSSSTQKTHQDSIKLSSNATTSRKLFLQLTLSLHFSISPLPLNYFLLPSAPHFTLSTLLVQHSACCFVIMTEQLLTAWILKSDGPGLGIPRWTQIPICWLCGFG